MLVTGKDLQSIEEKVGNGCTAGCFLHDNGLGVRVWTRDPKTGNRVYYQRVFSHTEIRYATRPQILLDNFAAEARAATEHILREGLI